MSGSLTSCREPWPQCLSRVPLQTGKQTSRGEGKGSWGPARWTVTELGPAHKLLPLPPPGRAPHGALVSPSWAVLCAGRHYLQPGGGGTAGRDRRPQVQRCPQAAGHRRPPGPAGQGGARRWGPGGLTPPAQPHPPVPLPCPPAFRNRTFRHQRGFLIWFLTTQGFVFISSFYFIFAAQFLNKLERRGRGWTEG